MLKRRSAKLNKILDSFTLLLNWLAYILPIAEGWLYAFFRKILLRAIVVGDHKRIEIT